MKMKNRTNEPPRRVGPAWAPDLPRSATRDLYERIPLLRPLLHAGAWYERSISRPARLLILVEVIALLFASLSVDSPVAPFALFLLALFMTDFLFGQILRPKLKIERRLPFRAKQGVPFSVSYEIENLRRLPAADLLIDPFLASDAILRIRGNEYVSIAGRSALSERTEFLPLRRGKLRIPQGIVESVFPFQLFKRTCVFGEEQELIIHPPCFRLRGLAAAAGGVLPHKNAASAPKPGESMDLFGCRAYRSGDPIRKIHWKSTARNRTLIVKEFQQERISRAGILFDVFFSGRRTTAARFKSLFKRAQECADPAFEAAVSLCASIADTLASMEIQAGLLALGTELYEFEERREERRNLRLLDLLATIRPASRDPFLRIPEDFIARVLDSGVVFFVTTRWDDSVRALLRELEAPESKIVPILVGDDSLPPDAPETILSASPKAILNGGDVL